MLGAVAACLLYAIMGNVLNLLHADAFVQRVAVGLVLLLALSIEGIRQRLFERASRRVLPPPNPNPMPKKISGGEINQYTSVNFLRY